MPSRRDPGRARVTRLSLRVGTVGALVMLAPLVASCAGDGDSLARQEASGAIQVLSSGIEFRGSAPREADYLAAQLLTPDWGYDAPPHPHVGILGWSGYSGSAGGARIDVRLIVDVDEAPAEEGIFAHTAGSAIECWRLTVLALRRDDPLRVASIPCPASPDRAPHPAPLPALPPNADALLQTALATATPDTLDALVHAAFPGPGLSIDTFATEDRLFAAVGAPDERECLIGKREANSTVAVYSSVLEDYEPSCSTTLFFEPTLTG